MADRNGVSKRKDLPREIDIGNNDQVVVDSAKKRPRPETDNNDNAMSSPSPISFTAKSFNGGTPASGAISLSNASTVARSIVKGEAKRPPPPPSEPPPRPTEIVKILCLGPESPTRKRCILHLTKRSAPCTSALLTPPAKSKSNHNSSAASGGGVSEQEQPCTLEYHKKDYTFRSSSSSGQEKAVRMQFLHLHGSTANGPSESWEETRHKMDLALLIVDLHEMFAFWEQGNLEIQLHKWRSIVNEWTSDRLPINLLLTEVSEAPLLAPAKLLRLGADVAQACRRANMRRWFLMGSDESDSASGLDSTDAVLQSLVEDVLAERETNPVGSETSVAKATAAATPNVLS